MSTARQAHALTNPVTDPRDVLRPEYAADDRQLLDLYVLLVLTTGEACTLKDIHDAWAVARQRTRPDHRDLVPFGELSAETRGYDVPFRDAVIGAARVLNAAARRMSVS